MRPEPDLPRRPTRGERRLRRGGGSRFAGRGRAVLGFALGGLFLLLISLRGIASFYTDYLWFQSIDLGSVWSTILGSKLALTLIGTGVFFILCWGNLVIAERLAPVFRPSNGDDDLIERYHEMVGRRAGLVRLGMAVFLALTVGVNLGSAWNEWVLFNNRVDFGEKDATFGKDVGFYVFQLPFLTTALAWLFSALFLILIVVVLAHLVNGGIRFQSKLDRVTPQVKAHISVLLGVLALVQGARYWVGRYELTFSQRGVVDGALYTDFNVELRSIYLLMVISLFAFALFIANIWRRGWVLPSMAVGLWMLVAILAGGLVPAFVQRFRVEPSESSMEKPYIQQNIDATRLAYGLDEVDRQPFEFDGDLDASNLQDNVDTLRNIRLWDTEVTKDALVDQEIRGFYEIGDVDVDRYMLDGELTQVMVAARNLDPSGIGQSSWEATRLAYTHGQGLVVSKANAKTRSGNPSLLAEDVPVVTKGGMPEIERAGIYFGEDKAGYVIVDTDRSEIDYTDADGEEKLTTYDGADGIRLGSGLGGFVRKSAFALRFGDVNPLISGNLKAESKVLIERDVRSRLESVAPFLSFDHDPYAVVLDGEVKWVLDGYTTTANYPNAQHADTDGLSPDSGLAGGNFNYARNSVKAVVDAYDGDVDLYVVDSKDPLIKAYSKAFPDLLSPVSEAPEGLREHFRYPEDLFTVQTQMWARYQVSDPDSFYTANAAWAVPGEPGENQLSEATTTTVANDDGTTDPQPRGEDLFKAQYLLTRMPGDEQTSFLLMRPYVAASSDGRPQRLLTSFMVARSDGDDYGKLQTYVMPSSNQPQGPLQAAEQMQASGQVPELRRNLCQEGSECTLRNLVMVPIDNSLLYVWSLFVGGDNDKAPRLARVIVSYQSEDGTEVGVDTSLRGALVKIFGEDVPLEIENTGFNEGGGTDAEDPPEGEDPEEDPGTTTTTDPGGSENPPSLSEQEDALLTEIFTAFDAADAAAKEGDLVTYAEEIEKARAAVAELQDLRDSQSSGSGSDGGSGSGDGEGSGGSTTTTTEPQGTTTTTRPPETTTTTSAGA